MSKNRLEAMTDAVVAIILTLLVLDLKTPEATTLKSLLENKNMFIAYITSFIYIVIIWNAHHQLFYEAKTISRSVIWINFFWMFWLSLSPFATSWFSEDFFAFWPAMIYAVIFAMWTFSFSYLSKKVAACNPKIKISRDQDLRSKVSIVINCLLLFFIYFFPPIALIGRLAVAILWVLPEKILQRLKLKQ